MSQAPNRSLALGVWRAGSDAVPAHPAETAQARKLHTSGKLSAVAGLEAVRRIVRSSSRSWRHGGSPIMTTSKMATASCALGMLTYAGLMSLLSAPDVAAEPADRSPPQLIAPADPSIEEATSSPSSFTSDSPTDRAPASSSSLSETTRCGRAGPPACGPEPFPFAGTLTTVCCRERADQDN